MLAVNFYLTLSTAVWVIIILIGILIASTIFFYRFTVPPISKRTRILFSTIRSFSIILLLLLLFEPILYLIRTDKQPPTIAVLIDNTLSISATNEQWKKQILELLRIGIFSQLTSDVEVLYYRFSSALEHIEDFSTLSFTGEETNISESFNSLKKVLSEKNIHAVVLLSDGNYNVGKNPIYDAENLGIPVYTIGVGDTTQHKDILIQRLISNEIAYAETNIPVDVTIQSFGHGNENVEIIIQEGNKILDRKTIALQEEIQKYKIRLTITPLEEGVKKYTVTVSSIPGEITVKNNSQSFYIKVLKGKLNVLIVAGAPHPDVTSIRQALTEDQHFIVRALSQKNSTEFYGGNLTSEMLDSADCLVFIGFPTAVTHHEIIEKLRRIFEQTQKPLLFIGGRLIDFNKLRLFDFVLPFDWTSPSTSEVQISAEVVERFRTHSLITLSEKVLPDAWQQLPPIFQSQTNFRAKPDASTLVQVVQQHIPLQKPLIVTRNLNRQKVVAIIGHGIWRWRLMAQHNPQTENILPLFITNSVRWLTTKEDKRPVRISPSKETFTTVEPIEFSAQVYDDQLRPIENAEIIVDVSKGDDAFQCELRSIGNGIYEGRFEGLNEGDYTFSGKATYSGRVLGEDSGKFSVGKLNIEYLETKLNKQLLEHLALRTGGRYYDLAVAKNLERDISKDVTWNPKYNTTKSKIELWRWEYLLGIIIFLFGIEWFLRRKRGML